MRANNNFTIGRILWQVQTIVKKKLLIAPIQHNGGNRASSIFPILATVGATIPANGLLGAALREFAFNDKRARWKIYRTVMGLGFA
jgi:hypothetical protein